MQNSDIAGSKILIDTYDGYKVLNAAVFKELYLAPDDKIYISTSPTDIMHVINYPNNYGKACSFVQQGIKLPVYISDPIPNMANYKLGKDVVPCATSTAFKDIEHVKINVSPNPMDNETVFDMQGIDSQDFELLVIDISGKLLRQEKHNTNRFVFKKENLSNGVYFYQIKTKGEVLSNGKLMILQ